MKRLLIVKKLIPGLLCMFMACNDISPEDRYISLPPIEVSRVVLLEDYTGQGCTNCPDAHLVMEQLLEQYPNQLVCVSVHAGPFAYPSDVYSWGLKTAVGDEMAAGRGFTASTSYPKGIVDGQGPYEVSEWPTVVRTALEVPSECSLSVEDLSIQSDTLRGTLVMDPGATFDGRVGVWLLESDIDSRQNDHGTWNLHYTHNHVLRAVASSSPWGEVVSLSRGVSSSYNFSFPLSDAWNRGHLSVVAFVTHAVTGSYMQTIQIDVQ